MMPLIENMTNSPDVGFSATEQPCDEYSILLDNLGVAYTEIDYHLLVGTITREQGWLLHISVIRSQFIRLLRILTPILTKEQAAFKIPRDKETLRNILDGNLGSTQIGKAVTIFPDSEEQSIRLLEMLLICTSDLKGPSVLTDIHLGGQVYTRYGSFDQLLMANTSGIAEKYIRNEDGNLVKDIETIPFQQPKGMEWPFGAFASPLILPVKKTLRNIYRPIVNLKSDPRGNVTKALYLKNLLQVKWCVIKQGIKNMWSDDYGRDIPDRLSWQNELHHTLGPSVPIPKVLDFFSADGTTCLVMEYVKGKPLIDKVMENNPNSQIWKYWKPGNQIVVVKYLLELINVIERLHHEGFVHRDITPVNFIIDNKNRLILIDIELAYSLNQCEPTPPFAMGTYGFMSPQQENMQTPTVWEDIYGLGATMINIFTGISPVAFSSEDTNLLAKKIDYFIDNKEVSHMIAACLHHYCESRPRLSDIKECINEYHNCILSSVAETDRLVEEQSVCFPGLEKTIQGGIHGLAGVPTFIERGLWISKMPESGINSGKQKREYGILGGLAEGLSGTLYFLAEAKKKGFDISRCQELYTNAWEYIDSQYLQILPDIPPGLYGGGAGIALALNAGLASGLIDDSIETQVLGQKCLDLNNSTLDLANGIAGQGMAILECDVLIKSELAESLSKGLCKLFTDQWKREGFWIKFKDENGTRIYAYSFAHGNTGILWYLLHYIERYSNNEVTEIAVRSIDYLVKSLKKLKTSKIKNRTRQIISGNSIYMDGVFGSIKVLIKAFEIFKESRYKREAEELLSLFPPHIAHDNFNYGDGLSGLGLIYLQAANAFKSNIWYKRSEEIVNLFLHTNNFATDDSCYWQGNNKTIPTAGLLSGNSGILLFMLQFMSFANFKFE